MSDKQLECLETVSILAKLIRKSVSYDNGQFGRVSAVPVSEIAKILEEITTVKVSKTSKELNHANQ